MAYLLQGFFFQNRLFFSKQFRAESEGGVGITIGEVLAGHMFAAVFASKEVESEELVGEMVDEFGEADIFDIKIAENSFTFKKKYQGFGSVIQYTFTRSGVIWLGNYEGESSGSGEANCILTEVADELFVPASLTT